MDAKYQDIHICHRRTKRQIAYRQLCISKIVFGDETIFVYYKDTNGIEITMGIPKAPHIAITID